MSKFCSNCGKEVDEKAYVCLGCGAKIESAPQNQVNNDPEAKSRVAAGLLGIFFGVFGVHNFYLGYTGKAVAQLLISLLSCGILAIVSEIWGLIEAIMILVGNINVDAKGRTLKD